MWNPVDLAWATGLFEGEGCIFAKLPGLDRKTHGRNVFMTLTSTDEDVVRKFAAIVGLGRVYGPYQPSTPNRKPKWNWCTTSFEHTQAVAAALWSGLCSRRKAKVKECFALYASASVNKKRPGPRKAHTTQAQLDIMLEMKAAGLSQRTIAMNTGMSASGVSRLFGGSRLALQNDL